MSSKSDQNYIKFSDILLKVLKENDLTQRELAVIMGKSESQISRWVNKDSEPIAKSVKLFEQALNVSFFRNDRGWSFKNKHYHPKLEEDDIEYMSNDERYYRSIIDENKMLRERVDMLHDLLIEERKKSNSDEK